MNISKLNQAFNTIVKKQVELNSLDINDRFYASVQHELDQLKSEFQKEYGAFLHEAIFEVHDEYCSDNEVLLPIAYIASNYLKSNDDQRYDLSGWEGVEVEVDDFPGVNAKLVLMPDPIRLELRGDDGTFKEVVWEINA